MSTLLYANQYFTTTLNVGGGIDASQTTGIILSDVSGIDTAKPGMILINYSDPLNTTLCEWIEYASINGSKELVGAIRGSEGFSAKSHDNGITVAFPLTESHINRIAEKLNGNDTGVILDDVSLTGTPTFDSEAASVVYSDSMSRQAIINGNFDVWQRGTTSTGMANDTFLSDRWKLKSGVDGGTFPTHINRRISLTAGDIPNSFYGYEVNVNGAGTSLGASSYYWLWNPIEHGTRLLCGLNKEVTVSFWAKSDIANKRLGLYLSQTYGTGGSPTSAENINGTNWTLTSTWTKYTHTFTTNTLVGKTFGTANDDTLVLSFMHVWGSTYQDRAGASTAETFVGSGNIDIAQVQLCAGNVALPFMPKSFEEELRACQRYYEKSYAQSDAPGSNQGTVGETGLAGGIGHSNNVVICFVQYKVEKRIKPTVVIYGYAGGSAKLSNMDGSLDIGTVISASHHGTGGIVRIIDSGTAIVAGNRYWFCWSSEAEL